MSYFKDIKSLINNKNFTIFWACMLVSQAGDYLQITIQSWFVLEITNSPFAVTLMAASGTLPQLIFVIVGGFIADRYSKKKILQIIVISQVLISSILTTFVIFNWATVPALFLLTFLLGVCAALWQPIYLSCIPQMVSEKQVSRAMGLSLTGLYTARTIGPFLAGILISLLGVRTTYLFNTISFLFPLIALLSIKLPENIKSKKSTSILKVSKDTGLFLLKDSILFPLWVLNLSISLLVLPIFSLMSVYARDVLNMNADGYGLLLGCAGIGQLLGATATTLLGETGGSRYGAYQLIGYVLIGLQVIIFSLSRWVPISITCLVVFNFLHGLLSPRVNTIVQLHTPTLLRGKVQSLFLFVFGLVPIGQICIGWIADSVSPQMATSLFSIGFTLIALFILTLASSLRSITIKEGRVLQGSSCSRST